MEASLATLMDLAISTAHLAIPLLFAALGGFFSERSGVINICLEGKMLVGAFFGAVVAFQCQSAWLGFGSAVLAGGILAAFYAFLTITLYADQIVAGTAMNLLAAGIPPFVAKILFDTTGSTPSLTMDQRFTVAPLWIILGVFCLVAWFARFARGGLHLYFAGEHPQALEAAGVNVRRTRWFGVLMAGALAGAGGATLSLFLSSGFSRDMTAGRGFMALAALILGKWTPWGALLACLLFGFTDAVQIRLQGITLFGSAPVPVQFIQMFPYLVTLIVLAGFVGKSAAPKFLGRPLKK